MFLYPLSQTTNVRGHEGRLSWHLAYDSGFFVLETSMCVRYIHYGVYWRKLFSMTTVKVRPGDSIDKALRALKKRLDKEGVMKAVKAHRFYAKPSVKKRVKSKLL